MAATEMQQERAPIRTPVLALIISIVVVELRNSSLPKT
jgi:hypothetical protein